VDACDSTNVVHPQCLQLDQAVRAVEGLMWAAGHWVEKRRSMGGHLVVVVRLCSLGLGFGSPGTQAVAADICTVGPAMWRNWMLLDILSETPAAKALICS